MWILTKQGWKWKIFELPPPSSPFDPWFFLSPSWYPIPSPKLPDFEPPRVLHFSEWNELPSPKLTACTWKWMVGILVSFWDGLFSGAFAVSFREGTPWKISILNGKLEVWEMNFGIATGWCLGSMLIFRVVWQTCESYRLLPPPLETWTFSPMENGAWETILSLSFWGKRLILQGQTAIFREGLICTSAGHDLNDSTTSITFHLLIVWCF